jgi:hypothetical protein
MLRQKGSGRNFRPLFLNAELPSPIDNSCNHCDHDPMTERLRPAIGLVEQTAEERKAEYEQLLEQALKQPGVREALCVYEAYARTRQLLDPVPVAETFTVVSATKTG